MSLRDARSPAFPRVVVTGLGVVAPNGIGVEAFGRSLFRGESALRVQCLPEEARPEPAPGEVSEEWLGVVPREAPPWIAGPEDRLLLDPFARFALDAANEAIARAGAGLELDADARIGVLMGTSVGGDIARNLASHRVYALDRRPSPTTIPRTMANAGAAAISIHHGIRGPCLAVSAACASGAAAIALGFEMIRRGLLDAAVVGGSESLPSHTFLASWRQLRVLSRSGCRPFARDRDGLVLGEGAGALLIEREDRARRRGARIVAEILGAASTSEAHDLVQPAAEGMAAAMTAALADAGLSPGAIAYLNAHGTATVANDLAEAAAIMQVFGVATRGLAVSSTKPLHGHALGAAGAIEAVATILALEERRAPPMPLPNDPDPAIALDVVRGTATPLRPAAGMSTSFAFGGHDVALVFAAGDPLTRPPFEEALP